MTTLERLPWKIEDRICLTPRLSFADESPLGFEAGDTNLYRYVGNSPTNATDPSGLATIIIQGGVVSLVFGNGQQAVLGTIDPSNGIVTIDQWLWNPYQGWVRPPGNRMISLTSLILIAQRHSIARFAVPDRDIVLREASEIDNHIRAVLEGRTSDPRDLPRWFDDRTCGHDAIRTAQDTGNALIRTVELSAAGPLVPGTISAAQRQVFNVARSGGKHAGLLRTMASRPRSHIQNAIRNLEKKAKEHAAKAFNPAAHAANWATLTPSQQQQLVRTWLEDAVNFAEEASVLRGLLEALP